LKVSTGDPIGTSTKPASSRICCPAAHGRLPAILGALRASRGSAVRHFDFVLRCSAGDQPRTPAIGEPGPGPVDINDGPLPSNFNATDYTRPRSTLEEIVIRDNGMMLNRAPARSMERSRCIDS
jgi:hypothetical protein